MTVLHKIGKKAGFVLAVAGAAIVGGAATALVSAAIPSSTDGQVHACYRNNAGLTVPKGNLRVIDDSNESCTGSETSLNWLSSRHIAYAAFASPSLLEEAELDTEYTENILAIEPGFSDGMDPGTYFGMCFKVGFTPKQGTLQSDSGPVFSIAVSGSTSSDQAIINSYCDEAEGFNAYVGMSEVLSSEKLIFSD